MRSNFTISRKGIPPLLPLIFYVFLFSCSSERQNAISVLYHNTTAHYNAYYIAREELNEAEFTIANSRQENYNEILPLYHPMDEGLSSQVNSYADEAIEKASLPIQYHKNSKWVDNSYILIGRARFYKRDFPNAIQTFKYVNSKSEESYERHEALSWLLRSYIEAGELHNARAVSDFLALEGLDKKNVSKATLARAHFFIQIGDLQGALDNIALGVKYTKPKKARARLHFIAAQIAQEIGMDETAEEHYNLALKSNPSYELEFYSKLYLAQVSGLDSETDKRTIEKFFLKLLKDQKNRDFRDKIYYEMAKFELKQDNVKGAIGYLNESIKASVSNQNQKAYSYLMLAEIYYERSQKYELSKAYYDSTLQVLDDGHKDYEFIKKRHEILIDFTTQLSIVRNEDSLQNLARMDSTALLAYIDEIIDKEEEEKRLALELQERQSSFVDPFDEGGFTASAESGGTWYFYNPSSISIGRTEFTRLWGNRKLEDHWRRSDKGIVNVTPQELAAETIPGFEDYDPEKYSSKEEYEREKRRVELLTPIPFSAEALSASNKRLEDALYLLGKIYNLSLEEYANATEVFIRLLEDFPNSEYKLEVMYFLYRINIDIEPSISEKYKNILLNNYPNSVYAKLILNPNHLEDSEAEDRLASELYNIAYTAYQANNLEVARGNLQSLIANYPESSFIDKAQLLLAMIIGKSGDWVAYKKALEDFIATFKESELLPFAKELLATCNQYMEAAVRGSQPLVSESTGMPEDPADIEEEETGPGYTYRPDAPHFFVLILSGEKLKTTSVMIELSKFNNKYFKELGLSSNQLLLKDDKFLFSIREFGDSKTAMRYYEKAQGADSPVKKFKSNSPKYFLISTENFPLFYEAKDIGEYMSFFREKYQ